MSETAHSPGPWKQHLVDELQVIDAKGGAVAIMNGDYEKDAVRMEANARLIAAAPTMFFYIAGLAASGNGTAKAIIASITAA